MSWRIGKYEAMCEGNDYWTDQSKLQKQVDFLEKNDEFAGCAHQVEVIYQNKIKKPHDFRTIDSNYGTNKDSVVERIDFNRKKGLPPLIRVHVGPYSPNYKEAKKEFKSWLTTLRDTGFLDIVSIG
ncbi:MAG: hypothetical protein ACOCWC_04615, partial [Bacteroidota bacterium]